MAFNPAKNIGHQNKKDRVPQHSCHSSCFYKDEVVLSCKFALYSEICNFSQLVAKIVAFKSILNASTSFLLSANCSH